MRATTTRAPQRGDVVEVVLLDGQEDPTGNPLQAQLRASKRCSIYWDVIESCGIDALVLTTTHDDDGPEQAGFVIYPLASVREIRVLRRPRRK